MTFFEAIGKCYRKYVQFNGRAPKSEYWWFVLLTILFAWPLFLAEIGTGTWYTMLAFLYFFLTVSAVLPLAAVWTRRMHDVGRSAWSGFFIFIPIVGFFMLLRWTFKEGDLNANKFGEPDNFPFVVKKQIPGPEINV